MADSITDVNPISQGLENDFLDGFKETDREFIAAKGFKSNDDVVKALKGYSEFDGLDIKNMVSLPGESATEEEINSFYSKLGRPESADKYAYAVPDGENGEFAKAIMPILFNAGITQGQLDKIIPAWNDLQMQTREAQAKALAEDDAKAVSELKQAWGAAYDKNIELARRAAQAAEFNASEIDELVKAKGSAWVYKTMAKFGKFIADGEIRGANIPAKGGVPADKNEALARLNRLMKDQDFAAKYAKGDAEAVKEFDELHKAAYGG